MARLSNQDWLDLGLSELSKHGPSAVRIEALCAAAGRTKGSFYHHFKDRNAFIAALLDHWAQKLTQAVIDKTENAQNPVAKLIALNTIARTLDMGVEKALRRWAGTNSAVAKSVAAVDKRRVEYVASLFMQAKNIDSQLAIDLAVMNYAVLVGSHMMFSDISAKRRYRIDKLFVNILNGLPDHSAP